MSHASASVQKSMTANIMRAEPARERWFWLKTMPLVVRICIVVVAMFVVAALAAPIIAPHDPTHQDLVARLQPPVGYGGTLDHPLGTDQLGRDVFSRVLYGARVSLGVGLIGMLIGLMIGTTIGIVSGFRGGFIDDLSMFMVDVQLALPFIIIALAAIAVFGTSLTVLITIIGLAYWESYARVIRGMTLSVRQSQYVVAAEALGAGRVRIMSRHILPNIIAPLVVLATFQLTLLILLETTLSFLGIGVQPPTPSWGSMIGEGRNYLNTAWWMAVVPGIAIILATMSISLIGDWLRDVLDPTLRGR